MSSTAQTWQHGVREGGRNPLMLREGKAVGEAKRNHSKQSAAKGEGKAEKGEGRRRGNSSRLRDELPWR